MHAGLLILTPSYWLAANPAWCLAEKGRIQPAAARKRDGKKAEPWDKREEGSNRTFRLFFARGPEV